MNETALFEDNNGGDIIEFRKLADGRFHFQVGVQCVLFAGHTGTISALASWLASLQPNPNHLRALGVDPYAVKDAPTAPGFYWFKGGIPAKTSVIELENRGGDIYIAGTNIIPCESQAYARAAWGPKVDAP